MCDDERTIVSFIIPDTFLYGAVKGRKLDRNLYEFRDISEFAYDILCAGTDENGCVIPSEAGKTVARRYREILIDEYQDSNFLQEDILNCVTGHGEDRKNMFMVGDIKQSIYRFRMARPDLFLNKYNTYSGTDPVLPYEKFPKCRKGD